MLEQGHKERRIWQALKIHPRLRSCTTNGAERMGTRLDGSSDKLEGPSHKLQATSFKRQAVRQATSVERVPNYCLRGKVFPYDLSTDRG
jgi:hypothetical protein